MARTPASETRHGIEISHPRYIVIPKIGMSIAPGPLFVATLGHIRRMRAEFDLIDAHYFYPDGVAAAMLGRALRKPVVITARGTDVNLFPRYALPRRMIRFASRNAAAIIAVSAALRDALVALDIPRERVSVLRNGVDLAMFRPGDRQTARARLGVSGRMLLSVGYLIERKGHDLTIAALPSLDGFSLMIVGEGPERQRLMKLASSLGVSERVKFLGSVPHEKLRDLYLCADALVLSSSREGWPNVLLEAMACGTPVVASAIWGNPEIVSRPEAGVLMQTRTPEGVAEAVKRLFAALPARDTTRAFAEKFSWEETSMGQIGLFERVLAQSCH
jgi:glycosyltransferase involved in cell wall biosynthesis